MNLIELGGLLQKERERRGLTVRDVMDATKISRRNLNALEAGDASHLPHPVYLKGYVRNYARLVGLDADPLVAVVEQQSDGDSGYLPQVAPVEPALVVPDVAPVANNMADATDAADATNAADATDAAESAAPQAAPAGPQQAPATAQSVAPQNAAAQPAVNRDEADESQIRFPKSAGLGPKPRSRVWLWVVFVLLAGALAGLVVQYQRIQSEVAPPPVAVAPVTQDNATNATEDMNATLPEADNATEALPEPQLSPAPMPPMSAPGALSREPSVPAATAVVGIPPMSTSSIEVSRKAPAPAPAVAARTQGMQELLITAKPGEACWVEVSEGAQRKAFILRDGESRRFEFSSKAKVRLGNAGGVSFKLNGASYPFEGQRGQTASLEIGAR